MLSEGWGRTCNKHDLGTLRFLDGAQSPELVLRGRKNVIILFQKFSICFSANWNHTSAFECVVELLSTDTEFEKKQLPHGRNVWRCVTVKPSCCETARRISWLSLDKNRFKKYV